MSDNQARLAQTINAAIREASVAAMGIPEPAHHGKEIPVKGLQAHLAQLRSDAAECRLLGTLATDNKSEMFVKMAEHLNGLASEIEKTIAANRASAIPAAPQREATINRSAAADHGDAIATDATAKKHQGVVVSEKKRSPRIVFAWLMIVAIIAGALLWISSQQSKYKPISEQLKALDARIDHLEGELDKLKNAPAPTIGSSSKAPSEEVKPTTGRQPSPLVPEESNPPRDTDQSTLQNPTKPPDSNSPTGLFGQTGTTALPEGELGGRKPGSLACEHFRSFDAASGTYVTFDGHRRPGR